MKARRRLVPPQRRWRRPAFCLLLLLLSFLGSLCLSPAVAATSPDPAGTPSELELHRRSFQVALKAPWRPVPLLLEAAEVLAELLPGAPLLAQGSQTEETDPLALSPRPGSPSVGGGFWSLLRAVAERLQSPSFLSHRCPELLPIAPGTPAVSIDTRLSDRCQFRALQAATQDLGGLAARALVETRLLVHSHASEVAFWRSLLRQRLLEALQQQIVAQETASADAGVNADAHEGGPASDEELVAQAADRLTTLLTERCEFLVDRVDGLRCLLPALSSATPAGTTDKRKLLVTKELDLLLQPLGLTVGPVTVLVAPDLGDRQTAAAAEDGARKLSPRQQRQFELLLQATAVEVDPSVTDPKQQQQLEDCDRVFSAAPPGASADASSSLKEQLQASLADSDVTWPQPLLIWAQLVDQRLPETLAVLDALQAALAIDHNPQQLLIVRPLVRWATAAKASATQDGEGDAELQGWGAELYLKSTEYLVVDDRASPSSSSGSSAPASGSSSSDNNGNLPGRGGSDNGENQSPEQQLLRRLRAEATPLRGLKERPADAPEGTPQPWADLGLQLLARIARHSSSDSSSGNAMNDSSSSSAQEQQLALAALQELTQNFPM